jgi:hypothetical protein
MASLNTWVSWTSKSPRVEDDQSGAYKLILREFHPSGKAQDWTIGTYSKPETRDYYKNMLWTRYPGDKDSEPLTQEYIESLKRDLK